MFKTKKSIIDPSNTDTLIGEGTTFEGNLNSKASVRIEGSITGDIECGGDVIIGESGTAHSKLTARDLVLAGTLIGNVKVTGKLTICSTGTLKGNIEAGSFIIEAGGIFNGSSTMLSREELSSVKKTADSANHAKAAI